MIKPKKTKKKQQYKTKKPAIFCNVCTMFTTIDKVLLWV